MPQRNWQWHREGHRRFAPPSTSRCTGGTPIPMSTDDEDKMQADGSGFHPIPFTRKAVAGQRAPVASLVPPKRVEDDLDAARGFLLAVVLGAMVWTAMGVIVWMVA